ncbi:MAG: hypothetical protein OSB62_06470 [Alphaproteobacteria bacterium]|nr:hypothetical protein [Alphaproteobacteria bacterium]
MTKITILGIDIQNDFQDQKGAALPVPGATVDSQRSALFLNRLKTGDLKFNGHTLHDPDEIILTFDTHEVEGAEHPDIAHPQMWRDAEGNMPPPFTMITFADIKNGVWKPYDPDLEDYVLWYTLQLEETDGLAHFIWPVHCKLGTWGHEIQTNFNAECYRWEKRTGKITTDVLKGKNPLTEHYGAIHAQVQLEDPHTQVNEKLLERLRSTDLIFVMGQALSHCVNTTIRQCAELVGKEHIGKFVLLRDCMSPVAQAPGGPDFPAIGQQFLTDMANLGMTVTSTQAIYQGRV